MTVKKIKVLIIDDSASVRMILSELITKDPTLEVIAAASDPIIAETHMKKQWPDVIVLDLEMPRKNGLTFLKEIMEERPTPVVICSSYTEENANLSLKALAMGACEIITKPKIGIQNFLYESSTIIIDAIKSASQAQINKMKSNVVTKSNLYEPKLSADVIIKPWTETTKNKATEKIIAIGASAGGTTAIESILRSLPKGSPGVVIVQHMPEKFTKYFSDRLNNISEISVMEAKNNDIIQRGQAYIAPGNHHLLIKRNGKEYYTEVIHGPLVNRHRPSIDVLFRSVATSAGKNALGIILTGMGDDGAAGMLEMHRAGAFTIAQNKETSLIFGMPKEAINRGGVDTILPLNDITQAIVQFSKNE